MSKRLSNKTAIITGGNSGMVYSSADTFIANGPKVIITGHNEEKLKEAVSKLGPHSSYIVTDNGKQKI